MPAKSRSASKKTSSKKKPSSSKAKRPKAKKTTKKRKAKAPKNREAAKLNKIFDELKDFRKEAGMISETISSLDGFRELKHASQFKDSLDNLTFVVNRVYELFSEASNEMYQEHELNSERINPLTSKLDKLVEQNSRLSDAVLELLNEIKELKSHEMRIEKELQTVKLRSDLIALREAGKDTLSLNTEQEEDDEEISFGEQQESPYYKQQERSDTLRITNPKRFLPE
ncbi:MAG TPA: hypothetical protein ENN46_00735 [Candidatus Woesearchaeota archaeon]|nr:hypothetical protein [Candidatus Woesearchaeota archaeon]